MHSGMFGGGRAERDARADGALARRATARGRPSARRAARRRDAAHRRGARAWAQLPPGRRAARRSRARADRARRGRGVLPADVRGHVARRERDRGRLARSREDRPARARRGRTSRSGSLPARIRTRFAPPSSGSCARRLPAGAELEITVKNSARPGARRRRMRRAIRLAADAFEQVVGARPLLVRVGRDASDLRRASSRAGCRRSRPVSASRASATSTRRTRTSPRTSLELGVATLREVFIRLGELGG